MSGNAKLHQELSKQEKRYGAAKERIKNFKVELKEEKKNVMKERMKYEYGISCIEDVICQRKVEYQGVQIATQKSKFSSSSTI